MISFLFSRLNWTAEGASTAMQYAFLALDATNSHTFGILGRLEWNVASQVKNNSLSWIYEGNIGAW